MFRLEEIADELRGVVATLDAPTHSGRDAARLTKVAAEGEKLFAAAKVLFARRAVDGNGWRAGSDAILPEQWFARLSGCSESEARRALKMGERLADLPATENKLRDGSLSLAQASICAEGAAADPGAEPKLLSIAAKGEMRRLREAKERVVTAAMDEAEARRRAHRERSLRTWTQGLSTHGSFQGPTEEVAVLLAAIEPLKRQVFTAARKTDQHDTPDAYRYDGLIELGRRAMHVGGDTPTADSTPVTRLRVGLGRLLDRGDTPGEEVCEIPGVGPIPVAHARKVLPHGLLELVITDGVDVQTVVSRTRHVPEALKIAIEERDQTCNVEGCDRTDELERHHLEGGFAEHHLTTYKLLGNACPHHHDLITYEHYEVIVNDDGSWTLRPPDEQRDTDAA
jgi:hypothetical protein